MSVEANYMEIPKMILFDYGQTRAGASRIKYYSIWLWKKLNCDQTKSGVSVISTNAM